MIKENNWIKWIILMFKKYISESNEIAKHEILDLYECEITNFKKAHIRLSGRHIIERNISDIVTDMTFLEGFDKQTIRTLTYIATVERLKPDYSIVVQQLGTEVDEYILEIGKKNTRTTFQKSPSEVSKDKELLQKLSPLDANRVGYLAGVKETVKEFNMKAKSMQNQNDKINHD